jgi:DNA polymerase-3 subunit epsilon
LRSLSLFGSRRSEPVIDFGHDFALVDVETTGLYPQSDRVVQIAVRQVDRHGKTQNVWHSLVDPGRDPGPTHIHGITTEMLRGAPRFTAVAPKVAELVAGRVLVAHNASFDWGFLQAESVRCVIGLQSSHRLCTLALARRLDLDVRDHKLGTLAAWARIQQLQAHSAVEDVRVLEAIFLKLMTEATQGQVTLPMSANTAAARQPWGERAPAVTSAWAPVGSWTEGQPLVQGMKFVITGGTRTPRDELYLTGIAAGLTPMNSVSSRTSFLVCNNPALATRKAIAADDLASPVITEDKFRVLLQSVQPGTPIGARPVVRVTTATAQVGRLKGCRVLVLGGPHDVSARVRDEVMAHGGRVAVNLTPTVSHLIALGAADTDIRYPRTTHLLRLDPVTLLIAPGIPVEAPSLVGVSVPDQPPGAVAEPAGGETPSDPVPVPAARILRRGEVTDLPDEVTTWDLFVSWTLADPPLELDVVALVTDADEKVLSDEHFVFFNALETPGREVRLEIETNGESRLVVDLDELSNPGVRVVVGASLAGGRTFGELGPVELVLRDTDGAPWARTVLDAGTTEHSLVLAEFYQRAGRWRFRAVGQGYEEPLAGFATRYGVDVA